MPFSCQFRLFFLPFPPLGSVYGSVHRTTKPDRTSGSAELPNRTESSVVHYQNCIDGCDDQTISGTTKLMITIGFMIGVLLLIMIMICL